MRQKELLERIGITYRQLDYWVRQGYLKPVHKHPGIGNDREWTNQEFDIIERLAALTNAGVKPDVAARVARGEPKAYQDLLDAILLCNRADA